MISVPDAIDLILETVEPLETRVIPIENALSYALANDVVADRPIPPFNRVAMDGYAVKSSDFTSDTVTLRIVGKIQTGVESDLVVNSGEAVQIMTGAPCPSGADAVVMVEKSVLEGERVTLTEEKIRPWLNIAREGEDAPKGKVLIPVGTPLSHAGIAICASVGLSDVVVHRKPTLRVVSTGTEIIPPSDTPQPHQIRDCNSFSVRSMGRELGLQVEFLGIGMDEPEILDSLIKEGLEATILILSGGVSMGEYDHIPSLLIKNGVEKIFHHVKIKPGKPIWFGKTSRKTFVFGLPGNPVSVQSCFKLFVEPLIRKLSGYRFPEPRFLSIPLKGDLISKTPRENYLPGQFITQSGQTFVEPVNYRGSGDYSNLEKSHGMIKCPADKQTLKSGSVVEFLPWNSIQ